MAGATYFPPDETGQGVALDTGDTVPASTWTMLCALAGTLNLAIHDAADPGGVVWIEDVDGASRYFRVEPSTVAFREVDAVTAGTGLNGGDYDYATPAVYLDSGGVKSVEPGLRSLRCPALTTGGTHLLTSNTAYFVYLGRAASDLVVQYVAFHVSTAGAGAQTAEVGIYTSESPPDKTGLVLTRIEAHSTLDDLTTTGVKRNASPMTANVARGLYVWAALRTAMATTQPTLVGLEADMGQGNVQEKATAGALSSLASTTGSVPTAATGANGPDLRAELD